MKKKTGIILTVVVLLCVAIAVFVYGNIKGDSANQGNSSTTQDGIQTEQLKEDEKLDEDESSSDVESNVEQDIEGNVDTEDFDNEAAVPEDWSE